jgi:hypothetical protein
MNLILKSGFLLLTLSYNSKSMSISRGIIHPVKQKLNSIILHEFHVYNYPRSENPHFCWKLRDFLRPLTESWRPATTTHILLHSVRLKAVVQMVTKSLVTTLFLSRSMLINLTVPHVKSNKIYLRIMQRAINQNTIILLPTIPRQYIRRRH